MTTPDEPNLYAHIALPVPLIGGFDYIVPDVVHVLMDGKIVKTGDKNLALELEDKGYDWIKKEVASL